MEFKFDETILWEDKNNNGKDTNSYMIVSKAPDVEEVEMQNVIQIIDETGHEVSYTYDKFIETFDTKGLSGFIM